MRDLKRILCPTDFSDASRHALDHAVAIARWYQSHITGLHVLDSGFVFEPPILFAERGGLKALPVDRDYLRNKLTDWMQPAAAAGIPWSAHIEDGRPAEGVLQVARSLPADLIVIGTHGRRGFEHLVLGSVTERVLRQAVCPVLTVPPRGAVTSTLPYKRLLCAVDFSEPSLQALQAAVSLAEEADADLTVLNVVDWPDDETFLVETFDAPDMRRQLEAQRARQLLAFIPEDARVFCRPSAKVAMGTPHREIVTAANSMSADLIVIGVHGRSTLDLALFGSTANQVVRRASCPVLTMRSRE